MIKPTVGLAVCYLTLLAAPPASRFSKYRAVESYEITPGILLTPVYAKNGEPCEISIEKRHRSGVTVEATPMIAKEQIRSLFDELVPQGERGNGSPGLPSGAEMTEVDGPVRTTQILYENVTLTMYGTKESQNYAVAIITWNKRTCAAK
jgi:hypothetical protein